MLISILLSTVFVIVCYKFDLFPEEIMKKKNRSKELHKELEDFYLEKKAELENKKSSFD